MVRIEWTDRSLEDLQDIYRYIARDSKSYANLFVQKIYKQVQKLKEFPKLGRLVQFPSRFHDIFIKNQPIKFTQDVVENIYEIVPIEEKHIIDSDGSQWTLDPIGVVRTFLQSYG